LEVIVAFCYRCSKRVIGLRCYRWMPAVCWAPGEIRLSKLQCITTAVQVYSGLLKFSVELDGWTFGSDGQFVDVDVIMKVPPGRAVNRKASKGRGHPVGFELGADASAYFSTKVDT